MRNPKSAIPVSDHPKKSNTAATTLLIAFVVLLLVLRFSPFRSASNGPIIGDPAPHLNSYPVEGTIPPITNQVVLLDFWASWCGPCELSMPVINEMHQRFSTRGLLVIGVSLDEDKEAMQQFLRKHRLQFTNVRDAYGHLSQAFHATTIPRTYLIAPDGKFLAAHEGFAPNATRNELIQQIESALKAAGK
jgi:thiol-disulfide isomerase/thioredoxin